MADEISIRDYVDKLREDDKEAVRLALASAKEAVQIAQENSQKWRDNANEWRTAMDDREKTFMTRKEFYSIVATIITVAVFAMTIMGRGK